MVSIFKSEVESELDPLQFVFRQGRRADDAMNSIGHLFLQHLEDPEADARLLLTGFSSALNTLQPHLLLKKTAQMSVNPFIIKWSYSFSTNRTQHVRVNSSLYPNPQQHRCTSGLC